MRLDAFTKHHWNLFHLHHNHNKCCGLNELFKPQYLDLRQFTLVDFGAIEPYLFASCLLADIYKVAYKAEKRIGSQGEVAHVESISITVEGWGGVGRIPAISSLLLQLRSPSGLPAFLEGPLTQRRKGGDEIGGGKEEFHGQRSVHST